MAAVVAVVAKVAAAVFTKAVFVAAAKLIGTIIVSNIVGRMLAKRAGQGAGGGSGGGRVQLPPATDNKIPVVYGSAYLGGPITAAMLTNDQKTMYYVVALSEKTDNGTISFGNIYYDGKLVVFGSDGAGGTTKVTSLATNNDASGVTQYDTKVNGYLYIYLYNNGSTSPTNTLYNAYDVLSDTGIPSYQRWDSNSLMTNTAFAIVKVIYNQDAGTTSLGSLTAQVINTESGQITGTYRPGTALLDYMTNDRYGCAIPLSKIDTASLTAVNTYSDQTITYVPVGGGSATQPRYRINGPLNTADTCLNNIQQLVDSCDSWLQYSELSGLWRVIMNKPYTGTLNSLYSVDSSNLVGGIQITPIDLNETYNEVEVAYPNMNIKDQTDYQVMVLSDIAPEVMSPNEATNRLNVTLALVNEAVQAKYLALRRLLQSREDITINFQTDFSGIQLEAGDVIRVTHEQYGWTDKLFRVLQVAEQTFEDMTVGAQVSAFEYNGTIYDDNAIQNFVPAFNTGLLDPNVIEVPLTPAVADGNIANSSTTYFTVTGTVPANCTVTYMDFNYGTSSNVANHILYRTAQNGVGNPFTSGQTVTIPINDLAANTYYFSVTARNDFAGRQSSNSNSYVWAGPQVSTYNSNTGTGGITGNNIQPNSIYANNFASNLRPITVVNSLPGSGSTGDVVFLTTNSTLYRWDGSGWTASVANTNITGNIINSQISNVFANSVFGNLSNANIPNANIIGNIVASQIANVYANVVAGNLTLANIPNTNIQGNIIAGQISNLYANVVSGSLTYATLPNTNIQGTLVANQIAAGAIGTDQLAANAVYANKIAAGTITSSQIATGTITATQIAAATITSTQIAASTIVATNIAASAIGTDQLAANAIYANKIAAGTITTAQIAANTILANNIAGNTITGNQIAANSVYGNRIVALSITANEILGNTITANQLAANSVTTNQIAAGAVTAGAISVSSLSAINANMGTLTSGTIQTAASPAQRVEISSTGTYPIWYGSGTKTAANAQFFLDTSGNAYFGGTLSAVGGTISIDTTAVGASGLFGFLKGAQFVLCRDGVPVTYPVSYPTGSDARVSVIFIGGGLTYSNDPNLAPPLYQNFQALDVTNTGFTPSLILQEAYGSGSLTATSQSFGGGTSLSKSLANVAYDNIYTATFDANIYCDYYIDYSEFGGSSYWYGFINVNLVGNNGTGNAIISAAAVGAYAIRPAYLGPGYENVTGLGIYGTLDNAGSGSMFYLTVDNTGYGSGTVSGQNLSWTYSSATANSISATPTGVPAVVALVYLQ